ncbi:hypothetical protein OG851_43555 (plasmid) [Streptomyces sp. NBC_00161]|uniref:hypothetical protein n=1 Tax=Streptomyces sp. NBC_00161 TaxID=2975671 RepID=UPI002F9100BA
MTVVLAAAVHILFCEEDVLLYKAATRGPRTDLRGARGADEIGIEATVVVHGVSEGVEDDDRITVGGTVASDGRVLGGPGNDHMARTRGRRTPRSADDRRDSGSPHT